MQKYLKVNLSGASIPCDPLLGVALLCCCQLSGRADLPLLGYDPMSSPTFILQDSSPESSHPHCQRIDDEQSNPVRSGLFLGLSR